MGFELVTLELGHVWWDVQISFAALLFLSVDDDAEHDFAVMAGEADGAIGLTQLVVALFR